MFIIKGDSVELCLCRMTGVCDAMLLASVVTTSLWNLLLRAKYIWFERKNLDIVS